VIEEFKKMKTGIDWHAFGGILGVSTAVVLQNFSTIAAGCAAIATALYMCLRVAREWRHLKNESRSQDARLLACENFKPTKQKNENYN
jgi:DNA-binding transcriptional regulator YdaS (Cro superfamily)